jgi:hypothetical protein
VAQPGAMEVTAVNATQSDGWRVVGPEPWRVEAVVDYDGPPPVPVEAVRAELEREFGDRSGWTVEYAVHIARFDGEFRSIPITVARHRDGSVLQWFPVAPDRPGGGSA